MRRALLPPALLLLLAGFVAAAPHPYDFLDNYRDPAPSPEDGPPASAHASRNKNLLPAQICGIVGAYVVTVLIWGILLLTVGRRMRRKTENSPKTLELELVTKRPSIRSPTSPIGSARSASSWRKIFKKEKDIENGDAPESPIAISPVIHSPGSFDQRVIDDNKARAQAEMERLYAAVMDHDRKKSMSQASIDSNEPNSRRPSAINTRDLTSYSNPSSPIKAIYPPGYAANGPPTAPLPRDRQSYRDSQVPPSPRSVLSKKSTASTGSKRFNLKNLRISGPIQKYPGDHADEELPPHQATSKKPTKASTKSNLFRARHPNGKTPPMCPRRQAQTPPRSAASSNTELPLRGYAEPLKSPDLRTTVLNRRMDHLSLTTPKTGVPYTPYSPYMPFTPVTPVTPHLVTKKERKMMKRVDGRKVPERGDMVQSPKEIFGDAW
ncbi:hypothetical protein N0V90_007203 [Kalmusia sp. IMI 367209]|nr:hypothetical protein N0V90_007203 [Kalmusia sp. IMI 367209]